MLKTKNLISLVLLMSFTVPAFADYQTKNLKNVTAGYGSTAGTTGFYILIKATTGELYLFNGANSGYTEERARAYLSLALTGKSTGEPVTFNATCLGTCTSQSNSIYSFSEIIVGSYP